MKAKKPYVIPTLAQERIDREREYLAFLMSYCANDVSEASELAGVGVLHMQQLLSDHHLTPRPDKPLVRKGSEAEVRLAALRGAELSASELHAKVGGKYSTLSVWLSIAKSRGIVVAKGEPGNYRYSAA